MYFTKEKQESKEFELKILFIRVYEETKINIKLSVQMFSKIFVCRRTASLRELNITDNI